jgi:hypothetical protein
VIHVTDHKGFNAKSEPEKSAVIYMKGSLCGRQNRGKQKKLPANVES